MYKTCCFKKFKSKLQLCNSFRCKPWLRLCPSIVLQQKFNCLLTHIFVWAHEHIDGDKYIASLQKVVQFWDLLSSHKWMCVWKAALTTATVIGKTEEHKTDWDSPIQKLLIYFNHKKDIKTVLGTQDFLSAGRIQVIQVICTLSSVPQKIVSCWFAIKIVETAGATVFFKWKVTEQQERNPSEQPLLLLIFALTASVEHLSYILCFT